MTEARQIELLCQLRDLLDRTVLPTLRDAGLTEIEAQELAEDGLVEFSMTANGDNILDTHRVDTLTPKAFGILSRAGRAAAPLVRTSEQPRPGSAWSKIGRVLGTGLWDSIKIALGGIVALLVAWYLWKKGWK